MTELSDRMDGYSGGIREETPAEVSRRRHERMRQDLWWAGNASAPVGDTTVAVLRLLVDESEAQAHRIASLERGIQLYYDSRI